jgi:outer membrane receptor protein involved in Fe transport
MLQYRKIVALASTAIALGYPALAFAQDVARGSAEPTTTDDGESAEIIVTAQKREERLLDVPVAVTALSSDSLIDQNLVSIRDYATRIPGLQIFGSTTESISLRGINTGGSQNPTVAILIDDVQFGSSTYLGRPPIPDLDPGILQRVEVLRGPQGTLYGASSLGGLIKYVTRNPSLSDFSGRFELGVNSVRYGGEGWSARGSVNIPIVRDRVGLSVSGFYRDDPRYIDSIVGGVRPAGSSGGGPVTGGTLLRDTNKRETWGGRAALLVNVTDNLTLNLSYLRQEQNTEGSGGIEVCSSCRSTGSLQEVTYDPRYTNTDLQTVIGAVTPSTTRQEIYTARVDFDLDEVRLTSVSAWSESNNNASADATGTYGPIFEIAFPIYPSGGSYSFEQPIVTNKFSQEVRLSGGGERLQWLAGVFYTNENSNFSQILGRTTSPVTTILNGQNLSSYEEMAAFGTLTFKISDAFEVQFGGRYSRNEQTFDAVTTIDGPAQALFGPSVSINFTSEEDAFTWLITPTYHINPDLMVYARVATGYRPGGPNTAVPGAELTFGSDRVINYELGLKGFVAPRLSVAVAAFQIDWSDIQLQNAAIPSSLLFFENGNGARSRGLEFAANWRPWSGFSLDGNATILDAELTEDLDPTTPTVQRLSGLAGDRLPYSARFSANLSAQQNFSISESVDGNIGANLNYVGGRLGLFNNNRLVGTSLVERARIPSYATVDLRGGLSINNRYSLNLYVRNLFNERGVLSVGTGNGALLPTAGFITPRTIGLSVEARF